ncbi:MAG: hypothetical protein OXQ29_19400, partial [Rhodospirillaceae bacterium]|nr:hypothetical protein [Rhodospirillaceae bacterium]
MFEVHGLARAVPLVLEKPGDKGPPVVGATGRAHKKLPFDDPQWLQWRHEALEELSFGRKAGLSLMAPFFVFDIDTKGKDDVWERVREPLGEVLAGAGFTSPFNTTFDGRLHGHYLLMGTLPTTTGPLMIGDDKVGDVLHSQYRYICTGNGYSCRWWPPKPVTPELLELVQRKPKPAKRRIRYNPANGQQAKRPLWDCLPCRPIGEGNRNNGLASVAGILRSREREGLLGGDDPEGLLH